MQGTFSIVRQINIKSDKDSFYKSYKILVKDLKTNSNESKKCLICNDSELIDSACQFIIKRGHIHNNCLDNLIKCSYDKCNQLFIKSKQLQLPKCEMCGMVTCLYHMHKLDRNKNYSVCLDCFKNRRKFMYLVLLRQPYLFKELIMNIVDFFPKPDRKFIFI